MEQLDLQDTERVDFQVLVYQREISAPCRATATQINDTRDDSSWAGCCILRKETAKGGFALRVYTVTNNLFFLFGRQLTSLHTLVVAYRLKFY